MITDVLKGLKDKKNKDSRSGSDNESETKEEPKKKSIYEKL